MKELKPYLKIIYKKKKIYIMKFKKKIISKKLKKIF